MSGPSPIPVFVLTLILLCPVLFPAADDAIRQALTALERGDFHAAELALRGEVQAHPGDAAALTLLGVALDGQHEFQQADAVHRRALASAPNSPDVLTNYANHLVNTGEDERARSLYLRVLAIDPAQANANGQLARLAVKRKNGAEALRYLDALRPGARDAPAIALLRLNALYQAGRGAEADALAARLEEQGRADLNLSFSLGMALAQSGQFVKAEGAFTQALALAPSDFNALFNLGVVAGRAGDNRRAREVLAAALRQQPRNVDVLYQLAFADRAAGDTESAVRLLAQAARLAPERADVAKLLAISAFDLGALDDAAAAWDRYLKLQPGDDSARRERGFTAVQRGRFDDGIADLQWFAARHPSDASGNFELGLAESKDDPLKGLVHLDKALALEPDFAAAHAARGSLYYQLGKPASALGDLEAAAALQPNDAAGLDRLGQTYLALDRPADAVRVLRRAAALAPDDSKTQLHFARALADAGETAESKTVMDRFRQLGPAAKKGVPGGFVDYLSMTPEERHADYRRRVEKMVREHSTDGAAQLSYLKLSLQDGQVETAVAAARRLAALPPSAPLLVDAGRALLESKQYRPAMELLQRAVAAGAPAQLDLAIAAFHSGGAVEGLRRLEGVPESARGGDFHLARAEMLDAAGDAAGSAAALDRALAAAPGQPALYRQAAAWLLSENRVQEALPMLRGAARALPREREISLLAAIAMELAGQFDDGARLLNELQARWPEWHPAWAAQGIVLASHGHFAEAHRALETAAALGAHGPQVRAYLAATAIGAVPGPAEPVWKQLVQEDPGRDW